MTTNLHHLSERVKAAEAALLAARDALRAAAVRQGLSREGLFSDSQFVLRTTAERWAREARDKSAKQIIHGIEVLRDAGFLIAGDYVSAAKGAADEMLADVIIKAGKKRRGEEA